jgi:hypothetical protein
MKQVVLTEKLRPTDEKAANGLKNPTDTIRWVFLSVWDIS